MTHINTIQIKSRELSQLKLKKNYYLNTRIEDSQLTKMATYRHNQQTQAKN